MIERVQFIIPGDPVAFARAGSFGARRWTPPKQRDYMLETRRIAHDAMKGKLLFEGAISIHIEAYYRIPASWSKKKQVIAFKSEWKISRPDVDNGAKIVLDSIGNNPSLDQTDGLGAIVFADDASVCRLLVEKRWSFTPEVRVTISKI